MISTKDRLAVLIYGMTNAVLFGVGIVPVLSIPSLNERAWTLIPIVVVVSLVLAWPVALWVTPRLRALRKKAGVAIGVSAQGLYGGAIPLRRGAARPRARTPSRRDAASASGCAPGCASGRHLRHPAAYPGRAPRREAASDAAAVLCRRRPRQS